MSSIDVSDISKEDFKERKEPNKENEKDKDKDKEKETTNLLDETQFLKGEKKILDPYSQLQKDNEAFFFLLLAGFIFLVYYLTKIKVKNNPLPTGDNPDSIQYVFTHGIESTDLINSFENRFKNIYPATTLELINDFPTLNEIFNSKIIYIYDRNITNKYIKHVKPFEDKEEEQYQKELYPELRLKDKFDENREGFYSTSLFIDFCNQGKLINQDQLKNIDKKIINEPAVSIIIPVYNNKNDILKTLRSIQNQSFKNVEIILVDDFSTEDIKGYYKQLIDEDPRVRVFYHMSKMGLFKSRLNGLLYSKGKYILHFNVGDLFSDNFILEDIYKTITKYNLDSLRFSYKTYRDIGNYVYNITTHVYPPDDLRIKYGRVLENVNEEGYGYIWNRLVRTNSFIKSLDNVNSHIFNAYKNVREDIWWNSFANYGAFGHTTLNRVGYINYKPSEELKNGTEAERDSSIKEIIYDWIFFYLIKTKEGKKKDLINNFKQFSSVNNTYHGIPMNLGYLNSNFTSYTYFLNVLIRDYFIEDVDKEYLGQILNNYTEKIVNLTNYLKSLNNPYK